MSKFRIYKASAGSGKTYSLVYEYLKILIFDPAEYKHILAVTFTNDATEEMKTRVLTQLKLLAENPESSSYLMNFEKDCGMRSSQIQKRAAEALGNILHDYSNFNISTIDTFFQKILRAFAKDIGLSAAYNLQIDHEAAVAEITENVIANTTDQNKQAKWLMKAAIEKIEDGKSWNIRDELKTLFKETFKENYQLKEGKIKESFQNENRIEELQDKIKNETISFENQLLQICSACNNILEKCGLNKNSFPYKESSFYAWVTKLSNKIITEPGTRFLNALDNLEQWYAKSASEEAKEAATRAYYSGLNEALKKLFGFYKDNIGKYNSNQLIKQNLTYFVMFESMVEEMMKYKSENDVLFISDTNQFIKEIIGDNDESFIFEKAGNYFHHYLIDEFQDTSQLQWNNFKPLISNAVSQGYTSLVVGDVKQSIYRFRNGDWRLLHEQAGAEITHHEIIHLKENHRSLENIIRFNNTLYHIAPEVVSNIYQEDVKEDTEWTAKFKDCYVDQEQLVPQKNKGSGGFIKINVFTKQGEGEDEEDYTVKGQQLNELIRDIDDALKRGYQPGNIAILVFTKKEAYTVANHLRKFVQQNNLQDRINIVTQSSLNISNSHTVRLLIAGLRYLTNKKDEISLAHVFAEYQQYFGMNGPLDFLEMGVNEKIEAFKKNSVVIKSMPMQVLVDYVIRFFNLDAELNEHIFLQHFKDALFDYLKKNADDLHSFMDWWEESYEKFQVEVPQNEKSLQIITIHKSKGLEFDLVFIPFAEWGLDSSGLKADLLWLELDEAGGVKTLPVKYDKKMQHSSFSEDYVQTKFYNFLDKLNLLYVATTRAIRELYIYSDRSKTFHLKDLKPNIKTILNHIMQVEYRLEGDQYLNLSTYINSEKDELIVGKKTPPPVKVVKGNMESLEVAVTSNSIFETLAIRQQSADLRDEGAVKNDALKQAGIQFHQIVAHTQTREEAFTLLNKLLLKREINKSTFSYFFSDFTALFNHPLMQQWMREYQVYSEYSFCIENTILKPDKFFINEHDAIVIDFKTGKPMPEYANQVLKYCNAVYAMFNKPVTGYIYYTQTQAFEPITI